MSWTFLQKCKFYDLRKQKHINQKGKHRNFRGYLVYLSFLQYFTWARFTVLSHLLLYSLHTHTHTDRSQSGTVANSPSFTHSHTSALDFQSFPGFIKAVFRQYIHLSLLLLTFVLSSQNKKPLLSGSVILLNAVHILLNK